MLFCFVLFFLAQRACVAYIWLVLKYAFICIPNTGRHIRICNQCSVLFPSDSLVRLDHNYRNTQLDKHGIESDRYVCYDVKTTYCYTNTSAGWFCFPLRAVCDWYLSMRNFSYVRCYSKIAQINQLCCKTCLFSRSIRNNYSITDN